MSRLHDMGGRYGDGPINTNGIITDDGEPVFKEEWHGRALAIVIAAGALGKWNIDASRFGRETLRPTDYARFSYYEKWLAGLANMLVAHGIVTTEELASGKMLTKAKPEMAEKCLKPEMVQPAMAKGGPSLRHCEHQPRFSVGKRVNTRSINGNQMVKGGHTRMPDYVSGRTGTVIAYHGTHVLPDSNAHFKGEAPEPLYAVAFAAEDLWPHPEHPKDQVVLDLWESYLAPA